MRLSKPMPITIVGRTVNLRGPLGVAVQVDTGIRSAPGQPLPSIPAAHLARR